MLQKIVDQLKNSVAGVLQQLAAMAPNPIKKTLNDLSKSLSGKSSKDDDDDSGDEEIGDKTSETKVDGVIDSAGEDAGSEEDVADSDEMEEDPKAKRKKLIKKITYILLGVYLAWEFILPEDTKKMIQAETKGKAKKEAAQSKTKNPAVPKSNEQPPEVEPTLEEPPKDEVVAVSQELKKEDPVADNVQIVDEKMGENRDVTINEDVVVEEENKNSSQTDVQSGIQGIIQQLDNNSKEVDNNEEKSALETDQQVEENFLNKEEIENANKQIKNTKVKMLVYSLPEYDELGRGLIYNCADKHWACINKENYKKCYQNQNYSKQNDKAPECHVFQIYASVRDCIVMQKHNTNKPENTSFCEKE